MTHQDLRQTLLRLEGRPYPAYRDIRGSWRFPDFTLCVDHVQGDPFAAPSRLRVQVPMNRAGFPPDTFSNRIREQALRDFLARRFSSGCARLTDRSGSGGSGRLAMDRPGQEILERSSIGVEAEGVEARFMGGLPARGRRILGREAVGLLIDTVAELVEGCLLYARLDASALRRHLEVAEDAGVLRQGLAGAGLVAFVADGAVLPRRSGVDDRPLDGPAVQPFESPTSLRRTFDLPHAGRVSGMGIPRGVTLIVGGGYHGKSTLLAALERGVYNHVPGDGRERVVTDGTAVKIRAEDGRRVEGVDLRPFITHLPGGVDPGWFCTDNASGSTSQAANVMEALEAGARVLLLDEDTCATNLMIRDARMQQLVEKAGEPITPFVDRIASLAAHGVSTVLVLGGSGDYFDVADTVIRMDAFRPREVTVAAKEIAVRHPTGRRAEATGPWPAHGPRRVPVAASLDPARGRRAVSIKTRALRAVQFGEEEIDVTGVSQLVDHGQLRAIARALDLARREFMGAPGQDLPTVFREVIARLERDGLDALDSRLTGDYAGFRVQELAATLNRLRSLRILRADAATVQRA